MRWIPLIILAYVMLLLQTSVGGILTFTDTPIGAIGPDLMAILAVYVAMRCWNPMDAMLAGWIIGFGLDLTAIGGAGQPAALGPMSIGYALAAYVANNLGKELFRDKYLSQIIITATFCLLAHWFWVVMQFILAGQGMTWRMFWVRVLQVMLLAAYTAAIAPVGARCLNVVNKWIFSVHEDRSGRARRRA